MTNNKNMSTMQYIIYICDNKFFDVVEKIVRILTCV